MQTTMAGLEEKKALILAHEKTTARAVARIVIEKPVLSVWMILVPIFFVYYFYRLKKYADGSKDFVDNFLVTRQRCLDEACRAVQTGGGPHVQQVVSLSSAPAKTHGAYAEWIRVLVDHYMDLLRADGDTYEALVRAVYKNRTNYLLFLNRLGQVEHQFDEALKPHLQKTTEGVNSIVRDMEKSAADFRRDHAQKVFP